MPVRRPLWRNHSSDRRRPRSPRTSAPAPRRGPSASRRAARNGRDHGCHGTAAPHTDWRRGRGSRPHGALKGEFPPTHLVAGSLEARGDPGGCHTGRSQRKPVSPRHSGRPAFAALIRPDIDDRTSPLGSWPPVRVLAAKVVGAGAQSYSWALSEFIAVAGVRPPPKNPPTMSAWRPPRARRSASAPRRRAERTGHDTFSASACSAGPSRERTSQPTSPRRGRFSRNPVAISSWRSSSPDRKA